MPGIPKTLSDAFLDTLGDTSLGAARQSGGSGVRRSTRPGHTLGILVAISFSDDFARALVLVGFQAIERVLASINIDLADTCLILQDFKVSGAQSSKN